MATLANLVVNLTANVGQFMAGMEGAQQKANNIGKQMQKVGVGLTAGVTAPMAIAGAAAMKFGEDLNEGMANVASLGVAEDRVLSLKSAVQEIGIETGKQTKDMSEGLYQVISAYGDTADTAAILETNAKAAAGGLATTAEAINLTSAVTKGYGDTSAEAAAKAADLALTTVQLGQTTFPELASSIGRVVPMAASLGATQEELFAQMATLTGVTGGAAEVSTQLRATYQALLKPTADMQAGIASVATELEQQGKLAGGPLVDAWREAGDLYFQNVGALTDLQIAMENVDTTTDAGAKKAKELKAAYDEQKNTVKDMEDAYYGAAAALGPAIVQSVGMSDALGMLSDTADGNTNELAKMFGSVEALNAVLALSGPQAEAFADKLAAMEGASGATDAAFAAQTEGINKQGFAMEQNRIKMEVAAQRLYDGLVPALTAALDAATPLIDMVVSLADKFAAMDPKMQMVIVGVGAVVAAVGPLLAILGTLVPAITAVGSVLATVVVALGWPVIAIGALVAAVAALVIAWNKDWGGIRTKTMDTWEAIRATIEPAIQWIKDTIANALAAIQAFWSEHGASIIAVIKPYWDYISNIIQGVLSVITEVVAAFMAALNGDWRAFGEHLRAAWDNAWQLIVDVITNLGPMLLETITALAALIQKAFEAIGPRILAAIKGVIKNIVNAFKNTDWKALGVSIIEGIVAGLRSAKDAVKRTLLSIVGNAVDAVKGFFHIESPSKLMRDQVGAPIVQGIAAGMMASIPDLDGAITRVNSTFSGLQSPSKLAYDVGAPIVQGIAASIMASVPNLDDAMDYVNTTLSGISGPGVSVDAGMMMAGGVAYNDLGQSAGQMFAQSWRDAVLGEIGDLKYQLALALEPEVVGLREGRSGGMEVLP